MSQQTQEIYAFDEYRIDPQERVLERNGAALSFTPKAFDLLLALVERHGRLVGKEELFQIVWPDTIVEESNLSYNMAVIRKTLGDDAAAPRFVETVPKRGYRFIAPVSRVPRTHDELTAAIPPPPEMRTEVVRRNRRIHPLLLILSVAGLVAVGSFATVRWFASRTSDAARPITTTPFTTLTGRESEPTFSPDGNQIAFVWNGEQGDNQDIFVKQIGNESLVRLTTNPAPDMGPSWSPDGRWIAFTRRASGEIGLYLIPSLGGAERKIAALAPRRLPEMPVPLSWTPDNEYLAVEDRSSPQEPYGIWLVARETGEKRRLTTPPSKNPDRDPVVSPDGRTILFTRLRDLAMNDLYHVPVTGGHPHQVVLDQDMSLNSPTWTPDGREILFVSRRDSGDSLWKVPATGGLPVKVTTFLSTFISTFSLSRDGNRLAWAESLDDTSIWRLELDARGRPKTPPQRLIASTRMDVDPRFSPDGTRIAFSSSRSGSLEIWVAQSDGQRPVQLTSLSGDITGSPRWSPDSRQIAFDSRPHGNADIYVISAEGGQAHRLTTESYQEALPSWSHDGAWIYFCSECLSTNQEIWKMPAAGGKAVRVTRHGGFDNVESPDGQYLYFTKGYVPGIWRIPVAGGEEVLVLDQHRAGRWRYWAVREQGIYFATAESEEHPLFEFFSFATKKVTTLGTLERKIGYRWYAGLDVSPDGRWLIWQQLDQEGSDIMLLDNFRSH